MKFEKSFGKNIKKFRLAKKLTQEQFAEKLDTSTNTISKIERGLRFVSSDTLIKITKILNVKPHELFIFDDEQSSEQIYKDVVKLLKTDAIKNDSRFLSLIYELIIQYLKK